jgi:hypothetical protein
VDPAGRAYPSQHFRVLAFFADPPEFLVHHQGPTAFAGARECENLDGEAVVLTLEAVPLARAVDAIQRPLRTLEPGLCVLIKRSNSPKNDGLAKFFTMRPQRDRFG